VFFRQRRLGQGGKAITVLKLRTMHVNAQAIFNADGSRHVGSRDPRVTRMGHFLRIGFDELPQVYNVLKGEMSFIGPRPDDLFSTDNLQGVEWLKLSARPGITGLAQVTGRNQLPWHDRLKYDVYYAYRHNLLLDLRIAGRTLAMLARIDIDTPLVPLAEVDTFLHQDRLLADALALQTKFRKSQA